MGSRYLGDTITYDFTTGNPLTGQVQDADALPTAQVFEDDNDVPVLAPVVVSRVGLVGNYRLTFDATAANGFEVGGSYNVIAQAVVAGITAKARIASFRIESPARARAVFRI